MAGANRVIGRCALYNAFGRAATSPRPEVGRSRLRRIRGLVHVHSSYSYDCEVPLAAVAEMARARGLRFVGMTEHSNRLILRDFERYRREALSLSGPDLMLLPGIEYASEDNRIHILVWGPDTFWEDLRLFSASGCGALLDRVRQAEGVAILAHPERAAALDLLPTPLLDRLHGLEAWNRKTDRLGPSPAALERLRRYRSQGAPKLATVGLDLHRLAEYRPIGLALERQPESPEAWVALVREGRFRSFWGPFLWDGSSPGPVSRLVALASRWIVRSARRVKHARRA